MPASGRVLREDALVIDDDVFERIRKDMSASGPASDGDSLLRVETALLRVPW